MSAERARRLDLGPGVAVDRLGGATGSADSVPLDHGGPSDPARD